MRSTLRGRNIIILALFLFAVSNGSRDSKIVQSSFQDRSQLARFRFIREKVSLGVW